MTSGTRLSEAHYRAVVDSATDFAIVTTDPDGRITSWNPGAQKLLRWSEEDAVGRPASMIFTPEDRARDTPDREMCTARDTGRAEDERWHLRGDGSRFWASGILMRLEDETTGEHVGYLKILRDRTPQHEADLRLRESEAFAQALFESSADCVKIIDLDGRLSAMNRPGLCLMEIDDFALLKGKPWSSLWPEALRPEVERALADARAGGVGRFYGFCPTAKGTPKWWDVQVSAVPDANGRPRMLLSVSRDMTDRAEGQTALTESEARFRNLADHAPLMMWVTEPDGYCSYLNRRWYEFTGQTEEQALGLGWTAATHPDDQHLAESTFLAAVAAQGPFRVEYRLRRADGAFRWAIDAAAPRFSEDGRFLGHVGSVIDIDDRREAEDALRQANTLLAAVMESVPGVVFAKDRDGRMLAANRGTAELVGKPLGDIIGRSDREFLDDPAQADAVMANDQRVMAADRTEVIEEEVSLPDGTRATWLSTKSPFRDAAGAVIGLVGSSIDISERKRMEEALRRLNETLEEQVVARTAELERTHEQLRQAQKMEAVGQLTGGIAHDFNNLLTGVIGSLDMMQRRMARGESDKVERYVTAAMTSANRAAALTHRLLAFSRRQPLDPKPVNANRLVTGMEELLRRTIGESVGLEIVTAGGLWQTLCDPHQLESAILNLAINARDAMPDGGKLTIETCNAHLDNAYAAQSRDVRPGQYVCICVTDTCTGMDKDTIAKAFEPFFTTKPIGQGTGLGLSMIYGFARQSEGYAKIYSEPGNSTTVKLYLPRYYGEAEDAEEAGGELTDAHRAEAGEVVLVVEDETAVRDLVTDVLQELGYRPVEAADGPTGLKLLQSDMRVDLLVTDIGLPGLNGRQLADAARVGRPGLKVLFMTGYAENATLANGFLEPGMQMITKPFAVEALATRIRDMIEGD